MATALTSMDRSVRMRRISRPLIRKRGSHKKRVRQGVKFGLPGRRRPATPFRALWVLDQRQKSSSGRITIGADQAYDAKDFIAGARAFNLAAHVQKNDKGRRSNWMREPSGTRLCQPEPPLAAGEDLQVAQADKQIGRLAQVNFRGLARVDWLLVLAAQPTNSSACHGFSLSSSALSRFTFQSKQEAPRHLSTTAANSSVRQTTNTNPSAKTYAPTTQQAPSIASGHQPCSSRLRCMCLLDADKQHSSFA